MPSPYSPLNNYWIIGNFFLPVAVWVLTISTAKLPKWVHWMVVMLAVEVIMWQPSPHQPPCPSRRSKSQKAAIGFIPLVKCLRAMVNGRLRFPKLYPSAKKKKRRANNTAFRVDGPISTIYTLSIALRTIGWRWLQALQGLASSPKSFMLIDDTFNCHSVSFELTSGN